MNNNKVYIVLGAIILISSFFHFYKQNSIPPCINADEAAFSYNAYSVIKTGKDEFGRFLPLRFESFKDFKLPVQTYLSIPFIALFGLNDFSTRALDIFIGIAFIPLIFLITKELFNKDKIALLAAFFTSVSPGVYIMSRHAHEGVPATFFILLSLYFLIRFQKTKAFLYLFWTNIAILIAAFSYHTGRLFLLVIISYQIYLIIKNKIKLTLPIIALLLTTLIFPFFIDSLWGVNRVKNLVFYKNIGFQLRINEYIGEHPNRLIHNKLTEGIRDVTNRYLSQLSPEFFVTHGDKNWRFGFENLGIMTPIEYFFIFIGLYYLFKNKEKFRFLIIGLIAISPINNSLTWQDASLIRTYFITFPLLLIAAYGVINLFQSYRSGFIKTATVAIVISAFLFYLYNNTDIYFNHYPKRAVIARAWQCGYKEVVKYVKTNYSNYDRFYITDRAGQPYIYFLYYMKYDPAKYQKQAKISAPDKYGFGQIDNFDKYNFKFTFDKTLKKTVFIGYPDEFNNTEIDTSKIKKIKVGTEEIFWIYES